MCVEKVAFTEQRVKDARCVLGKKYTLHWDEDTPGLGLRVANTARSYVFEKRVHGDTMRVTIGTAGPGAWKLGDARKRARELTVLVDKGEGPRKVAAQQLAQAQTERVEAQRQGLVIADAWRAYIEANEGNGAHVTLKTT